MRIRFWFLFPSCLALAGMALAQQAAPEPRSQGLYRLPFADRTMVKVFDDFVTHRPPGRVDLFAVKGTSPYRVVAAAAGRIVAIQDSYREQQSGRVAADCHNNYVWIRPCQRRMEQLFAPCAGQRHRRRTVEGRRGRESRRLPGPRRRGRVRYALCISSWPFRTRPTR